MCDWKTCDVTPLPAETRPNQLLRVLPRHSTYNIPISFLSFFTLVTYLSERYYLYMVRVISVVLTPPSPKRDDFVSFYITVATSFLPRFPSWQRALWQPQLFRKSISRNVISHNIWNCRQILQMHAREHAESINSEGSVRK
jgi:hypothetical protein